MTSSNDDILFFYSKSKHTPAGQIVPGRTNQEYTMDPTIYNELNSILNWRHVLSNFYAFDFTIEVSPDVILTFRTIEHGFHYFKIRLSSPIRAFEFALESGTALSKGTGADAKRARKLVVLNDTQIQQWNRMSWSVMEQLAKCRFSQDPYSKKILLLTQQAQLWHTVSRKAPVRFEHLERIRNELA